MSIERHIRIVPSMQGLCEHAICFETGCSPEEVDNLNTFAFEHHGNGFDPLRSISALRLYHERMMLGQTMPQTLLLTRWWRIDQLTAATLFMTPALALEPACVMFVQSCDLVERLGPSALAHIPWDHQELIRHLRYVTRVKEPRQLSTEEALPLIVQCAQMITLYCSEGQLPGAPDTPPTLTLHYEDSGFISYTSQDWAWDLIWSMGAVWGVWEGPHYLEVRLKSVLVDLDPKKIHALLGEAWVEVESNLAWQLPRQEGEPQLQELHAQLGIELDTPE
jgi:hypothetical protein